MNDEIAAAGSSAALRGLKPQASLDQSNAPTL
jgi:hypothetical protein